MRPPILGVGGRPGGEMSAGMSREETGDYLLRALVDTSEKHFAYLHNPEFHAIVEAICLTLPGLLGAYASLGVAKDVDLKRKVDEAMRGWRG
jgi:hypothetical protein